MCIPYFFDFLFWKINLVKLKQKSNQTLTIANDDNMNVVYL